jgi:dynein heavy chain
MLASIDIGYFSSNALQMLEQSLSEIYIPLISNVAFDQTDSRAETLKSDFLVMLQKFSSQVTHTSQLVLGKNRLQIPADIANLANLEVQLVVKDRSLMIRIETLAEEWIEIISATMAKEAKKSPQGNGPLAEIEYWRDRTSSLSTLHEQLNLPIVPKIVQLLGMAQIACSSSLEYQLYELNKIYTEAKDNVKFLSTLERHFKNMISGSMSSVQDSLMSLMNAIRMVWIISRHYNRDERMVPLMSRIAWELSNKVANSININSIFREQSLVKEKIMASKQLLDAWSSVLYFNLDIL